MATGNLVQTYAIPTPSGGCTMGCLDGNTINLASPNQKAQLTLSADGLAVNWIGWRTPVNASAVTQAGQYKTVWQVDALGARQVSSWVTGGTGGVSSAMAASWNNVAAGIWWAGSSGLYLSTAASGTSEGKVFATTPTGAVTGVAVGASLAA